MHFRGNLLFIVFVLDFFFLSGWLTTINRNSYRLNLYIYIKEMNKDIIAYTYVCMYTCKYIHSYVTINLLINTCSLLFTNSYSYTRMYIYVLKVTYFNLK